MRSILQKKGNFNMLVEFALIVAVVAIVAILVFELNSDARDDLTTGGTAYNATIDADNAVAKIPKRLPLLATAIVFGVVIWVILRVIPIKVGGNVGGF